MSNVMSGSRPSKNERRDAAREKAREQRAAQQRREKRNRMLLQTGIGVVVLAIIAVVSIVLVNAIRPPGPGPRNMASGGISIQAGGKAVPTGALAAGANPPAPPAAPSGLVTIRAYEDFGCPYCKQFEDANSAQIAKLVQQGKAVLQIFPVSILDNSFLGTKYSTRSANAAAAVADRSPNQFLAYHKLLYANQPKEGTSGLSDEKLIAFAKQAKVTDLAAITKAIRDHTYFPWVADSTKRFLDGNLKGTNVKTVTGTPVIVVNGKQYTGSITDPNAFTQAILQTDTYTPTPTPSPSAKG
jgi:protein-disulfide isomerase